MSRPEMATSRFVSHATASSAEPRLRQNHKPRSSAMVSTRSKTAQTHLEDFATKGGAAKAKGRKGAAPQKPSSKSDTQASTSKKRKSDTVAAPATKKTKSAKASSQKAAPKDENEPSAVIINRAPVLQLWAACVTHLIYPSLPWSTCLSAGSAISTICAVAKGRSIGTISERDESEQKQRKREEEKRKQKDLDVIHVMQFKLKLQDGLALVGSEPKGKPGNEEPLRKKFGEQYDSVKTSFEAALESWKGDEEELNKKAFGFYEEFRPTVKSGQKGWGRKGELSLEKVRSTVEKE